MSFGRKKNVAKQSVAKHNKVSFGKKKIAPLKEKKKWLFINLMRIMKRAGHASFSRRNMWEVCFCFITTHLDKQLKVRDVIDAMPEIKTRMDEKTFLSLMANLGYICKTHSLNIEEIDPRLYPCIAMRKDGRPLVVVDETRVFDPSTRRFASIQKFSGCKTDVWFFEQYSKTKDHLSVFYRESTGKSWFRALLDRFQSTFALVLCCGFFVNILSLATPIFILLVYDRILPSSSVEALVMLFVGTALAFIFEYIFRRLRTRGVSAFVARLDNITGNQIFKRLLDLKPDLIDRAPVMSQVARIKAFESVREFYSSSAFIALLEIPFTLLSILLIGIVSKSLVAVPIVAIAIYGALFVFMRAKIKVALHMSAKYSTYKQKFALETFEKFVELKHYGLSETWLERFRILSGREAIAQYRLNRLASITESIAHTLTLLSAVITIWYGVALVWQESITVGALIASMILVWRILSPFYSLCAVIPRIEQLRNSVSQINMFMEVKTEDEQTRRHAVMNDIKGRISLDKVSFAYKEKDEKLLDDFSMKVSAGAFVCLHGKNGSGKSTVLKIVKGLYEPSRGKITIDSFDARQFDVNFLRRNIFLLSQDPKIFSGGLKENLRHANPLATHTMMVRALRLAGIVQPNDQDEGARSLDINTYASLFSKKDLAARVALAQLYLSASPILLIDEIPKQILKSSAGQNLLQYIKTVQGKKTVIMVTNDKEFLNACDRTISLDNQISLPLAMHATQTIEVTYA